MFRPHEIIRGLAIPFWPMLLMPGRSHRNLIAGLGPELARLKDYSQLIVERISLGIGERHAWRLEKLDEVAELIKAEIRQTGHEPEEHWFEVKLSDLKPSDLASGLEHLFPDETVAMSNIIAEIRGTAYPRKVLILGAHMDSRLIPRPDLLDDNGCKGSNDNTTGIAGLLAFWRLFLDWRKKQSKPTEWTVRIVFFANEETLKGVSWDHMGSAAYADLCYRREESGLMMAVDTIGRFKEELRSQRFPFPLPVFFPSTGDFIAFIGDLGSSRLIRRSIRVFRRLHLMASEGAALPGWQALRSDHGPFRFWKYGSRWQAFMLTDTASFRAPDENHTPLDLPDRLDYHRMTLAVYGLFRIVQDLVTHGF